jgi:uncharacterized protein YyaL (SSP411 family)
MIRAFLAAGRTFQREDYTASGQQAAAFLREHLWDGQTLYRSWRNGACSGPGFLEDYAAVALAWLDLAEADPHAWSLPARGVVEQMLQRFREPGTGALSSAGPEHGPALARLHDVFDQAMPSATSLAVEALTRASRWLHEPRWLEAAREAAAAALPRAARVPSACSAFLLALHHLPGPPPAPLVGPRETCEGGACELPP